MLYIILLLVVVLIIAVVLKKRSAAQPNTQSAVKGIAKKGSASKAATKAKLVDESIITKQETTSLDASLRSKIEDLIQNKNYYAAEAQINQALKRNNSQHELYLLLFDVHYLQKDEFATSQLLTHLRSLNLDDIIAQTETRTTQLKSSLSDATIEQKDHEPAQASTLLKNKVDSTPHVAELSNTNTAIFDQLQHDTFTAISPVVNTQPLEFELQSIKKEILPQAEEKIDIEPERSLDFTQINLEPTHPAPQPVVIENLTEFSLASNDKAEEMKYEIKNDDVLTIEKTTNTATALDFNNFSLETKKADEAITDTTTTLDFDNFSLETKKADEAITDTTTLDFDNFSLETEKAEEKTPKVEQKINTIELDFTSFNTPQINAPVEVVEPTVEQLKETLDFSFSQAEVNLAPAEPEKIAEISTENSLDFNFSIQEAPIAIETPVVEPSFNAAPNLDFNLFGETTAAPITAIETPAVVETIDKNDPLIQAFPELAEQSEVELNLVLATQYIELGAFDAARELLDEIQEQFNSNQQQRAQKLLNQLA